MIKRLTLIFGLLCALALAYVVTTVPPARAGAVGVLGAYILLYGVLAVGLTHLLYYGHKVVSYIIGQSEVTSTKPLAFRTAYYYASVLALGPIICISLKSVGKLDALGLLLTAALMSGGCIYVSRQAK